MTDIGNDDGGTMTTTSTITLPPAGTYEIDPAHSSVNFVARHLVGAKVRGSFKEVSGTIVITDPPENSTVTATATVASVDTGQEQRDGHLKSPDFFDAETYPTIDLHGLGITRISDTEWRLASELTVRGVTKPVSWDLEYLGTGPGMAPDSTVAAFAASTELDRRDFNVSFSHALADATLIVGNKIKVELDVEAHLQS